MIDEPQSDTPIQTEPMEEQQQPPKPPPSMDGNGKTETISDQVRKARELIPVDDRGVTPLAYEQQVTIAKDLSKAYLMLPSHLHNNAAVLTALVGIAARFKLDPAMLASQSYIQNGKLCFQSQAFGAILYASGLLLGRLRYEFHGEGEDMTCTVSGRFHDDPDTTCSATTPPLKLLHPGTVTKEGKGTFVKGSPLWDRDPEQQIGYFGQRRWIRRFAPDVCMGMYTREEIEEIDDFRAGRGEPLSADRLGRLETGEGWGEGAHIDAELAKINPEELRSSDPDWPEENSELEAPSPKGRQASQQKRPAQTRKPVHPTHPTRAKSPLPRGAKRRGRPASRAVVQAAVKRAELPPRRPLATAPAWLDYVRRADAWIGASVDPDKIEPRWDAERQERDNLRVPQGERSRLRQMVDRKIAQLRKATEQA